MTLKGRSNNIMFLSVSIFRKVQDKPLITIKGGQKLVYVLSIEIMTLTLKVIVTKKHEKMQISLKQG